MVVACWWPHRHGADLLANAEALSRMAAGIDLGVVEALEGPLPSHVSGVVEALEGPLPSPQWQPAGPNNLTW